MGKFIDLTGSQFGKLTVIERDYNYAKEHGLKSNGVFWKCQCICGRVKSIRTGDLKNGAVKSCGRCQLAENLTGQQFGKLTVLEREFNYVTKSGKKPKGAYWKCSCDCGGQITTLGTSLSQGLVTSCGCISSIGEENIRNLLMKSNIKFETQKTFLDLRIDNAWFYRYDFYLPDYNRLIEFDGEQHYSYSNKGWNTEEKFKKTQQADKIKNEYALSHNIDLIRILYWERDNINLEMLLEDKYLIKEVSYE